MKCRHSQLSSKLCSTPRGSQACEQEHTGMPASLLLPDQLDVSRFRAGNRGDSILALRKGEACTAWKPEILPSLQHWKASRHFSLLFSHCPLPGYPYTFVNTIVPRGEPIGLHLCVLVFARTSSIKPGFQQP